MTDKKEDTGLVELRRNQRQSSLSDTHVHAHTLPPVFSHQSQEFLCKEGRRYAPNPNSLHGNRPVSFRSEHID